MKIELSHNPLDEEGLRLLGDTIGSEWVSHIRELFDNGGGDEDWKPTQKPQKAAILKKLLNNGKSVTTQQLEKFFDENKKPLIGDGILMNSFSYSVTKVNEKEGYVEITVGSNVDYAKKMQEGGEVEIPITEASKAGIKKLLKNPKNKKRFAFLRPFLKKDKYTFEVAARKFLTFDAYMRKAMALIFSKFFRVQNDKAKKNTKQDTE